ncbi:MAG: site-2 protease family protein [Chloroflexi bacterium]|nr:site-2 protease family protein [Chloroflexota bacterium]
MGGSFRIARIAEIDIKIHVTFFLILILGAFQWSNITHSTAGAFFGVGLMLLLFVCVTLHELGHSLVARAFGIQVREITLLPLGGVAIMAKNPDKPLHELLIAAAGPLVNVVIAGVLIAVLGADVRTSLLDAQGLIPDATSTSFSTLLFWLLAANISLVVFNLIPAFPLDGGRMLRALLAMLLGFPRATRIATGIGQIIAVAIGVYGIINSQYLLVLTAVFIFFGASQENTAARSKTVLITQKIGDTYNKYALTLQIGDRVSHVTDYILTSYQPDFAVLQGTRLLGVVTREEVLRALALRTEDAFVTEIMQREVLHMQRNLSLDDARTAMESADVRIAAVYDDGNYLGLVSLEDIHEAFAVLTFMQMRKNRAARTGEDDGAVVL